MNDGPRLTSPQRRYEILGDSNDVYGALSSALGSQEPAYFDIKLADVYEGRLPIPEKIQERKLGMCVAGLTCRRYSGDLRAYGSTVDDSAETVTVRIPKDREKASILYLLDIGSTETE